MNFPNMYSLRHGLGDFVQVASYFSDEELKAFEVLYLAYNNQAMDSLVAAMRACPSYSHIKIKYLLFPTERKEGMVSIMRDHAILYRRQYCGSHFLKHELASIDHFNLPEQFDLLHLTTPYNRPEVRKQRDMKVTEWDAVLKRLEERDTVGVVVNPADDMPFPESDRLIDLRGLTSMPESIEILKRANGFVGIDSNLAILAAQLFKHDDLLIRSKNPHVVEWRWEYYAPHDDIGFLTPEFGKPRYPRLTKPVRPKGIVVELKCNALVGTRNYGAEERVEVPPARAAEMVRVGQGTLVEEYK